jgi:hypothetical protein
MPMSVIDVFQGPEHIEPAVEPIYEGGFPGTVALDFQYPWNKFFTEIFLQGWRESLQDPAK